MIYQVLASSFMDTNGDGEGDLQGIIERLDYLQWLGATAIWLTPIYPSPMADLGYDVSDYTGVGSRFGSLEDFDRLVSDAHARGIKIIMDWVPNHTSDQHPWFVESRSSRDSRRRDWYIWRPATGTNSPPTNWRAVFGGSAWEWDEATGEFYYHSFLESQPDLNWRNPEVQAAVLDAMRFWLRIGVDGFRVDAASWLIKDEQFRDNPPNPNYHPESDGPDQEVIPLYTWDQPGVHEVLANMRRVVDEFDDRLLAGELVLPIESMVQYYGRQHPELHLPLNMHPIWANWSAEDLGTVIETYERERPASGWPTWTLSTHDFSRIASRLPGDQTRVAAMLLLTLGGTPTHYYGEEVGMRGVAIAPEDAKDPQGRRIGRNRDPARTPMQWDASPTAGFTTGDPWLPIGDDVRAANVAAQKEDPHSLLTLYRRLIELRARHPTLVAGSLEVVSRQNPLLVYRRASEDGHYLVVLNMSDDPQSYDIWQARGQLLLSTFLDRQNEEIRDRLELRANEGILVRMSYV